MEPIELILDAVERAVLSGFKIVPHEFGWGVMFHPWIADYFIPIPQALGRMTPMGAFLLNKWGQDEAGMVDHVILYLDGVDKSYVSDFVLGTGATRVLKKTKGYLDGCKLAKLINLVPIVEEVSPHRRRRRHRHH